MNHKYLVHENCEKFNCPICDGGLSLCTVCGCAEGELPTDCPEVKLSDSTRKRIYNGSLDFINGAWIGNWTE